MLDVLISSKTRIKLLLKFFLNSGTAAYLRGLETEFGESTNAIRTELNRLEEAGMLESFSEGNKKFFRANTLHPLFNEIRSIVLKTVGLDQIVEKVIQNLGEVNLVYLTGNFAAGLDSDVIDLLLIGNVDRDYLSQLVFKVEDLINRKIRYAVYPTVEAARFDTFNPKPFLIWTAS